MEKMKNFRGVMTALVTPFKDGSIDYSSLENLIKDQLKQGVSGFVINGTTAESPTLLRDEVRDLYLFVKERVSDDFVLIMGTGSNSTAKTIEMTKFAEDLGADAALVVVPYYNKPPQQGLIQHFEAVANQSKIPVLLYNVPGRTIVSLGLEAIKTLAKHPMIIGIKEASGNIEVAERIANELPDFILLSGDDGSYIDFLRVGGQGVISVSSHIIGKEMGDWTESIKADRGAQVDGQRWTEFLNLLGVEANPIPVKMALHLKGVIASPELRLPLVTMSEENTVKLRDEMTKQGLL